MLKGDDTAEVPAAAETEEVAENAAAVVEAVEDMATEEVEDVVAE